MNPKKGLKPLMTRLRPDTIAAVKAEAFRRAQERGSMQPSSSEVIQEALDAWFAKRPAPKKRSKA